MARNGKQTRLPRFRRLCRRSQSRISSFVSKNNLRYPLFFSYYREYLNYFDAHIAKNSLSTTFQTHFPRLLPGCIGSSLHPLIHLGLGLDLAHTHLVSEGLAYACIAYSPIGELIDTQNGANAADVDPREILEMVRVDKRFDGVFDGAFGAKLKVLAKSRGALLKVYMDELNIEGMYGV